MCAPTRSVSSRGCLRRNSRKGTRWQKASASVWNGMLPAAQSSNHHLLHHCLHSAGVEIPTITITYRNLTISANVEYGHRTLPTLPNTIIGVCKVRQHVHREYPSPSRLLHIIQNHRPLCGLWVSLQNHTAAHCWTTSAADSSRSVFAPSILSFCHSCVHLTGTPHTAARAAWFRQVAAAQGAGGSSKER